MQNSMLMLTLFIFDWKYPFCENFVQKLKILSLSWNLTPRVIRICRIQWCCSLFLFRPAILLLEKFGPKHENCWFKLKFGTQNNPNMRNSMLLFTLSVFNREHPFCANLVQKVKIVSLSWNWGASLIRICRTQWCCLLSSSSTENAGFRQVWSKKTNLLVYTEIWFLN